MKLSAQPLTPPQFTLTVASVTVAVLPHLWRLPLLFSVSIAILLVGRWFQRSHAPQRIPIWIKLPLIILFPILIIFHYGNIFGREPGSALACVMLALKLLETDTRRDARASVCFGAFVLMSALLFDSGLIFTIGLLLALSLLLATLRELEPRPARTEPLTLGVALREGMRYSGFALLAAVPLAICVFVFFPRLGSPLWGAPTDATARTGLSDVMAPGSIQELLVDDSPAFRVVFHGPTPPKQDLYWRGPVLTKIDQVGWSRGGRASVLRSEDLQTSGAPISYEVTLEPSDRRWLLALDVPTSIPENTIRGPDMTLVRGTAVDSLLQYDVTSSTHYRLDAALNNDMRTATLQLPQNLNPRSAELAKGWRRDLKDDTAIIRAALDLFHDKFFYTLNAPLLGRDSVDDFLFNTQRGFCEHFASAFTFLMREAGIPARVVTGYQGGYYNDVGDYWVVRQSDAHAWSEVWLDGRGWVRVDPTAAVSPQRVELGARAAAGDSAPWYQADWLQQVRNQFDLVNRFWNDAIVQFNAIRQQNLLTPFGVEKADYGLLMSILIGTSSVVLIAFAWWVLRAPRKKDDPLDAAYFKLRRKLEKAGAPTQACEGPLTLSDIARTAWPTNRDVQSLIARYVNLRYAVALPPTTEVRAFVNAVSSLRLITVPSAK